MHTHTHKATLYTTTHTHTHTCTHTHATTHTHHAFRFQIDLIDLRDAACENDRPMSFRHPEKGSATVAWVLHIKDHFTKMSWAHALETKTSAEVRWHCLQTFAAVAPPEILQSDRGHDATRTHTRVHTHHTHTHTPAYTHTHTHADTNTHTHVHTRTHIHTL